MDVFFFGIQKKLKKEMEKFLLDNFTDEQKWILNARFRGTPYTQICQRWPFAKTDSNGNKISLKNQNIITCIRRSALGYTWSKGMKEGTIKNFNIEE